MLGCLKIQFQDAVLLSESQQILIEKNNQENDQTIGNSQTTACSKGNFCVLQTFLLEVESSGRIGNDGFDYSSTQIGIIRFW